MVVRFHLRWRGIARLLPATCCIARILPYRLVQKRRSQDTDNAVRRLATWVSTWGRCGSSIQTAENGVELGILLSTGCLYRSPSQRSTGILCLIFCRLGPRDPRRHWGTTSLSPSLGRNTSWCHLPRVTRHHPLPQLRLHAQWSQASPR